MNRITSLISVFTIGISSISCTSQDNNAPIIERANVATKTKTAQELRQEARQKRLSKRDLTYSFLSINGTKVHYRDQGTGTPVVLIHGMGSNLNQWNHLSAQLSKNYRVLSMDLPGSKFGKSGQMFQKSQADSIALFIDLFMENLKVDKAHIIGSSYGGAIAINLAASFKERVNKLVLISSASYKSPLVNKIENKTLIIWGGQDKLLPLSQGKILHQRIAGSELVNYDDGKHVPILTHPKRITKDIAQFLDQS